MWKSLIRKWCRVNLAVISSLLVNRELYYLIAWSSNVRGGNPQKFIIGLCRLTVQCVFRSVASRVSRVRRRRQSPRVSFAPRTSPTAYTPCVHPAAHSVKLTISISCSIRKLRINAQTLFISKLNPTLSKNGKQWYICASNIVNSEWYRVCVVQSVMLITAFQYNRDGRRNNHWRTELLVPIQFRWLFIWAKFIFDLIYSKILK